MPWISVKDALKAAPGTTVTIKGWVRTRRDSKADGGLSFLALHDGTCFDTIQIVAKGNLPNYATGWGEIDALVVPTAPIAPTLAQLEADPFTPNAQLGTYTNFVNLLDLSAIAVPGPFRSDGMPAGVTLIGERGADAALAQCALRLFEGRGGVATHEGALRR